MSGGKDVIVQPMTDRELADFNHDFAKFYERMRDEMRDQEGDQPPPKLKPSSQDRAKELAEKKRLKEIAKRRLEIRSDKHKAYRKMCWSVVKSLEQIYGAETLPAWCLLIANKCPNYKDVSFTEWDCVEQDLRDICLNLNIQIQGIDTNQKEKRDAKER